MSTFRLSSCAVFGRLKPGRPHAAAPEVRSPEAATGDEVEHVGSRSARDLLWHGQQLHSHGIFSCLGRKPQVQVSQLCALLSRVCEWRGTPGRSARVLRRGARCGRAGREREPAAEQAGNEPEGTEVVEAHGEAADQGDGEWDGPAARVRTAELCSARHLSTARELPGLWRSRTKE